MKSISLIFSLFFSLLSASCSVELPEKLIVGYASWSECDEKIITAVEQGVNVLMWFAINLLSNETTGEPLITGGPDLSCVRAVKETLKSRNLPTVHMITIGGWNAPHPNTSMSVEAVYQNWVSWSDGLFDGFDWDIEGNDDFQNPYNVFTLECLDLMGQMSQMGKRDGYIVSMAPSESYVDVTTSVFDTSLLHNYPEWEELQPFFFYHGHNCYSYLIHRYQYTNITATEIKNTFDFISVQFYEGYTHIVYNVSVLHTSGSQYLETIIPTFISGWDVYFDSEIPTHVSISQTQLVIGLANGWADGNKFLLLWPEHARRAYENLLASGLQPRGYMFWDIADEGVNAMDDTGTMRPFWMASGLNEFLHTRPIATSND